MLSKREWRVGGKHSLHRKAPGIPLMVSDYASFEFGLGIKVSDRTLNAINRLRSAGPERYSVTTEDGKQVKKRPFEYYDQSDSITIHTMIPGENKDGNKHHKYCV